MMTYTRVAGENLDNPLYVRRDGDGALVSTDPSSNDGRAFHDWLAAGNALAEAPAIPVVAPDNPTLSDWRVGLTLWGRIDDVTARVDALAASDDARKSMLGKVAKERFEYANNVRRDDLTALKDALGFSVADVEESLWRAAQVTKGDLSGVWPPPGK